MNKNKTESFEILLLKLEGIVEKLEQGDFPLEDSLKAFEEGMDLVKKCEARLNEAQKKIEILVKDRNGRKEAREFEVET